MAAEFRPIFDALRGILQKHSGALSVSSDSSSRYGLEGGLHPTSGKPMPVAWVEIKKSYVSYHLMPIYGCARLRHAMSNELKRRMQGKACFNFNKVDAKLFEELDRLTGESLIAFKAAGYLSKSK